MTTMAGGHAPVNGIDMYWKTSRLAAHPVPGVDRGLIEGFLEETS